MLKSFIIGITAASLTFSTPVHAGGLDRDDVGKLIIGIAAIATVNAILENRNRDKPRSTPVHDRNNRTPHTNDNRWADQNQRRGNWSNLNRQTNRREIPSSCLQNIETRFGNQRMFGQRCLERNYTHVNSLPDRCAVRVFTNNGPRRGFDPLCLREQGYRSDRRH